MTTNARHLDPTRPIVARRPADPDRPAKRRADRSPVSPVQADAAWAFVVANSDPIRRFCATLAAADVRLDLDDLVSEAILWIVRNHRSYDPTRSAPTTWAYLLCRRARAELLVALNRRREREVALDRFAGPEATADDLRICGDDGDQASAAEARLRLAEVLRSAEPEARACAQAVLDDLDSSEAIDFLGEDLARRRFSLLSSLGRSSERASQNPTRIVP